MNQFQPMIVGTLVLALSIPLAMHAQAEEAKAPPNVADIWIVHVANGNEAAFEAAFKAHVEARKAASDPRAWQVYTPAVGDSFGHYLIRYCCFEWSDQDAYDAWSLESALDVHWNENVHPHTTGYEHYLTMMDLENSYWPDDTEVNFVGVTRWDVKPGGFGAMEAARVALSKAAKEHGWSRPWSWASVVGGQGGIALASPYASYADMAPPEPSFYEFMSEKIGAEETAKLFSDFSGNLRPGNYTVLRLRKDLSMSMAEE